MKKKTWRDLCTKFVEYVIVIYVYVLVKIIIEALSEWAVRAQ